jgi:sulfur carrier protein
MTILLNGKPAAIEKQGLSVTELLSVQNVKSPDMVSVQLNGEFLKREEFDSTLVKEKDEVEFLYFMGGGSGAQP